MKIRDRIKELRRVKAAELVPNPRNWRTHPQAQQDALRGLLAEVGYADALLCREDADGRLVLVDGHLRAETTPDVKVPVLVLDVTEEEADKLLLTLDPLAAMAEASQQKLGELLAAASTKSEAVQALLDELAAKNGIDLFEGASGDTPDAEPQMDRAEELRQLWGTEAGQLWAIPGKAGEHRLLCGDSTKAEDVARVMEGSMAVLCLTDPPYSVDYDRSQEERGGNKGVHAPYREADIDPADLLSFMRLVPSDVMVWSYPIDRHFQTLAAAYAEHGWELRKELVWVKDSFSFWMAAKYQQKHEPIMLAVRRGKPIGGNVPNNATTVFEAKRPRAHDLHPTAKPIELWSQFVKFHSAEKDVIYEPFLGSGTTMLAAEQLSRLCYGIEISPAYCAVILQRMTDAGLEPYRKDT